MDHISLVGLSSLMNRNSGLQQIKIGLIDGPVITNHSALVHENIFELTGGISANCSRNDSVACSHGTFIAGILKAKRNSEAPALCPDCTLLIRPVFSESQVSRKDFTPFTTPKELSKAIIDCINANANIINLSLALASPSSNKEHELEEALNYAARRGVIIVAAAGNQGKVGSTAITRHSWVIPVIACNNLGQPLDMSNLSSSIGRKGLSAPGENIKSLGTINDTAIFSGTSVAVPFITGIVALLWSEFPGIPASEIRQAMNITNNRRSIIPPLANAMQSYQYLSSIYHQKAIA
jgi:subtilisin family serine protease